MLTDTLFAKQPRLDMMTLPHDIIVEIFMHLGVEEVLAMTEVSRSFHDIAGSRVVWNNLSYRLLCHSRPLPLKGFSLPHDLSAAELRRSVLRACALERNWSCAAQPQCTSTHVVRVMLWSPDGIVRVWRITSNYILTATEGGNIICWDIDTSNRVGVCQLGHGWIVFNCRADYASRRVFCIAGQYPEIEGNMKLSLLQAQFPPADSPTTEVSFATLAFFSLPHSNVLDLFILEPFRRLVCVLFLFPDTNTIGLYTLFDWNTGLNTLIDTGITFLQRNVTATSLSLDGAHILIHIESWESEVQMSYSIAELQKRASARTAAAPQSPPRRSAETTFKWRDQADVPADETMLPMGSYFFRQWWPTYAGVPVRSSTALIYNSPGTATWRLAQHFSSAAGPCAPTRFVAVMSDPVLVPHDADGFIQPLLDVDFSHAVWIEWVDNERKRMRLATFPDPETDGAEAMAAQQQQHSVKTLDVPGEVLDVALHLVIDQSQGSILISTFSGEFHIFQYA